jgi:hypothetical protein
MRPPVKCLNALHPNAAAEKQARRLAAFFTASGRQLSLGGGVDADYNSG